ncbi:hypothetical protein DIE06_17885 [Burkholderia sp. Bp8998]|nr:hypothetical protein DIE06_17885 [Burkholderia sp. Bp8998]
MRFFIRSLGSFLSLGDAIIIALLSLSSHSLSRILARIPALLDDTLLHNDEPRILAAVIMRIIVALSSLGEGTGRLKAWQLGQRE